MTTCWTFKNEQQIQQVDANKGIAKDQSNRVDPVEIKMMLVNEQEKCPKNDNRNNFIDHEGFEKNKTED